MTENSVWSLLCDRQGSIWYGTYYEGLFSFNDEHNYYTKYSISSNPNDGLSSSVIGNMKEDNEGNIWISTEGGGLCRLSKNNKFEWYIKDTQKNSISNNNVKCIYINNDKKEIWIGTHMGGLNKLDLKSKQFTNYYSDSQTSESIPSNIIMDIEELNGSLLLSTYKGIVRFNPTNCTSKSFFNDEELLSKTRYTKDLLVDRNNNLWILPVDKGVISYNTSSEKANYFSKSKISDISINLLYEDDNNNIWMCTNGKGIFTYNSVSKAFEEINTSNSNLSSNVIYAVSHISGNKYVVTTDEGYSIMDYSDKTFTNYKTNIHIPLSSTNINSLLVTKDKHIYIGGFDGLMKFDGTKSIAENDAYRILPYELVVNGKKITSDNSNEILTSSITTNNKIKLKSWHNIFTIKYTVTDFLPFSLNDLIYQMKGFSDEWFEAYNDGNITFTDLKPGDYILTVKIKNKPQIKEHILKITVLPPLYKTGWAYLIYITILLVISYIVTNSYTRKIKLKQSLIYEKQLNKDLEKLNQEKLRFFTNISHEFTTPITLIIGQVELLLESKTCDINKKILSVIKKNCQQLNDLISELIVFRKLEQGHQTLHLEEDNIVKFIFKCFTMFEETARNKHINYKFIKLDDEINILFDKIQIRKVMNNLISNAIKYTSEYGKIIVSVINSNQCVVIEVRDNGTGINKQDINKIFDRFYQSESDNIFKSGYGIGLALAKGIIDLHHGTIEVESQRDKGSIFRVKLLKGKEHFENDNVKYLSSNTNYKNGNIYYTEEENSIIANYTELQDIQITDKSDNMGKIMIFEKFNDLANLLSNLLKPFYSIEIINNYDSSFYLEKIKNELPDLVICDSDFSEKECVELCKKIRSNINTCQIPIMIISSNISAERQLSFIRCGADDISFKPFNIEIILSKCNNIINNRKAIRNKFNDHTINIGTSVSSKNTEQIFLNKAAEIIEKFMSDSNFSIDTFSKEMNVSRTNLFNKIRTVTGLTPAEYIMLVRLEKAVKMLKENPELNITEISEKTGFKNPKHFSRAFKEKYNLSPREYRKKA